MSSELAQSLRIIKFETRYIPLDPAKPDRGTPKAVDYVITAPRGMGKYTETPMRIIDVQRMTNGMWDIVEPHYEAWKKGNELPEDGTALAAWNGVNAEQADVLKAQGIRSVEDLAMVPDSMIEKLGMGMRAARDAAKRWVAATDTRTLAASMADKDAEIEALKQQMADLMAAVQGGEAPVKRPYRRRSETEAA